MKALRRSVKYSLMLLALLVGALLAAPLFIDMDDIKRAIEQEVEDATGRALAIGGVKASLFPWIGVHLSDVRLADRAGFSDEPMFRAASVDVKVALIPLLGGRYEVREFTVIGPEVRLERHADGRTNWGDLAGGGEVAGGVGRGPAREQARQTTTGAPQAAPKPGALPAFLAAFRAESLRIERGRLIWVDAMAGEGAPLKVDDISLVVNDVQFSRPVRLQARARALGGDVSLEGEIGPLEGAGANPQPLALDPAHLPLRLQWSWKPIVPAAWSPLAGLWPEGLARLGLGADAARLSVAGEFEQHADGVRAAKGTLQLSGGHDLALAWTVDMPDARRLNFQRLNLAVDGRDWLSGQGEVRLGAHARWRMRLKSAGIDRAWIAAWAPAVGELYAAHPAPWNTLAFGALLAGREGRIDIRDLQLRLDKDRVQISGSVDLGGPGGRGGSARLRLAAKTLHLDPWLPKSAATGTAQGATEAGATEAGATGGAQGEVQAAASQPPEPDLRFLKDWRVDLQVQIGRLLAGGLDARNLQAVIAGQDGRFSLDPLRFGLSGGLVEEKAELDVSVVPARWRESAHVSGVNLGPLLKAVAGIDWLEGRLDLRTRLHGRGLTPRAVETLSGEGRTQLNEGRIKGVDLVAMLQALGKGGLGAKAGTRFTQVSATFTAKQGVVESRDLFMVSPYLRVSGEGRVNLPARTLDWRLRPRLVGGGKGVVIPVRIHGPLDAPQVRPDLDGRSLVGEALKRGAASKPVKKLERRLQQELGGALNGLLPGLR